MNNQLSIELFGASHSKYIGLKVNPMPVGFTFNVEEINQYLTYRQGISQINTSRKELENLIFLSGVNQENKITAETVCFVLENTNYRSKDYQFGIVRPAHADLVGYQIAGEKFEYQGGGRFSGRLTALYVVLGIICKQILKKQIDIKVAGQIKQVATFIDQDIINLTPQELKEIDWRFPVFDQNVKTEMINYLTEVKNSGDSHGATLKFRIDGLEAGIGGMYFSSFESILSKNLFAIGAIKGISFGCGFDYQNQLGSQSNDQLYYQNNKLFSPTNFQGGINGGFTNGIQPVYFEVAIRPTPTIFKVQDTVKFTTNGWENYQLIPTGRHDSFIANRISVVIYAMIFITIYEIKLKQGDYERN